MDYINTKDNKNIIKDIIELGDSCRGTVGFLPQDAFYDYNSKGRIRAAINESELLGYIMFRPKNSIITIVQLCVKSEHRNSGIAKFLFDNLLKEFEDVISEISLKCRRDYNLDEFWRFLGFTAISETKGRSIKADTTLTKWVYNNNKCYSLFSINKSDNTEDKIVVLDSNIIIDLYNDEKTESDLLPEIESIDNIKYLISPEVLNEINKNTDKEIRDNCRNFAMRNFEIITDYDKDYYEQILNKLLQYKSADITSNTGYDLSHIAYSIAIGAQIFVTRDGTWLKPPFVDYVFDNYGLIIQSPGELIKTIDEVSSPSAYSPLSLSGLNLYYSEMSSDDYLNVSNTLFEYYSLKKKNIFQNDLRKWMANPQQYKILLVKSADEPISLVIQETFGAQTEILELIINKKIISEYLLSTFIPRVLMKIIDESRKQGINTIKMSIKHFQTNTITYAEKCGFILKNGYLIKYIFNNYIEPHKLNPMLKDYNTLYTDAIINLDETIISKTFHSIEKTFWPLKISSNRIPCYVVPIKASYAQQLFDEELANKNISFFHNEQPEPALSIENVYYKNIRKSIDIFPARILWYISADDKLFGSKAIRACSYLDRVETGKAKELFHKYRRLGVLKWDEIKEISKKDGLLAAYIFSYTELFDEPVDYSDVLKILRIKNTFQSFLKISDEQFKKIYCLGKEGVKDE